MSVPAIAVGSQTRETTLSKDKTLGESLPSKIL
jgi:hypothetical protein